MKNWLIEKLGGVPKQTYMEVAESHEGMSESLFGLICRRLMNLDNVKRSRRNGNAQMLKMRRKKAYQQIL